MNKQKILFAGLLLFLSVGLGAGNMQYWHGKERELRYKPDGEDFVIINGNKRFTRAIYGTNTGFRFETSDYPEFGLYMPSLGGSIYMALQTADTSVWIKDLEKVESRFISGRRKYILSDSKILGKGRIEVSAVALPDADGLIVKTVKKKVPDDVKVLYIYGGASGEKFSRSGDIGADPEDCFYITPGKCKTDKFKVKKNRFTLTYGSDEKKIFGKASKGSKFVLGNADNINSLSGLLQSAGMDCGNINVTSASAIIKHDKVKKGNQILLAFPAFDKGEAYISLMSEAYKKNFVKQLKDSSLSGIYVAGENRADSISSRFKMKTPDPYFNTLGRIISGAEDAIWQSPSYLHGAIGWRTPLTGWRGAYIADLMGLTDRARTHFDAYAASQVTDKPVIYPNIPDKKSYMARSAYKWGTPMYSNGYICRDVYSTKRMNHYDMNLVYIDELLWHLNWTGDLDYAKKIFPVIKRHLAWEKATFDPDSDGLYDAYCCIWASDALQYDGGAVTHSTAYNYRANKMAAMIARKIGEDPIPYEAEAEKILEAVNNDLWIKDKGHWAEFKDNMGEKRVHEDAAVWTVYHSIDSYLGDPFKYYQATRYVDTSIPHIPVIAKGLKDTDNYVVSTSDWQTYNWSINNVAFAEIAHTALSFWQANRPEKAYKMLKGAILDAMYLGSGPGNITQISFYDAARGESYRDFADPSATLARAIIYGMYGLCPDLLNDKFVLKPLFPEKWNYASMSSENFEYSFIREKNVDKYVIKPKIDKPFELTIIIPEWKTKIKYVKVNGRKVKYSHIEKAVGRPQISITTKYNPSDPVSEVKIGWDGDSIDVSPIDITVAKGDTLNLGQICGFSGIVDLYDPQGMLKNGQIVCEPGEHTVFVKMKKGDAIWWKPVNVNVKDAFTVKSFSSSPFLSFEITNNRVGGVMGDLSINGNVYKTGVEIPKGQSVRFLVMENIFPGTNKGTFSTVDSTYNFDIADWEIRPSGSIYFDKVNIASSFNDKVTNIFKYDKYVSPRWPYTTLQVPTQGMGEWCKPKEIVKIDDAGIRAAGDSLKVKNIPFSTPADTIENNIAFTTLWDSYPDSLEIKADGRARKAYFLMAASTYHMQCHFVNGYIKAVYKDGTCDVLNLVNPDNIQPLSQAIYTDGYAFRAKMPMPYRISLKTGRVTDDPFRDFSLKMINGPVYVDGGMATMVDMVLDPDKELDHFVLRIKANEVIIGIMAVTLMRDDKNVIKK